MEKKHPVLVPFWGHASAWPEQVEKNVRSSSAPPKPFQKASSNKRLSSDAPVRTCTALCGARHGRCFFQMLSFDDDKLKRPQRTAEATALGLGLCVSLFSPQNCLSSKKWEEQPMDFSTSFSRIQVFGWHVKNWDGLFSMCRKPTTASRSEKWSSPGSFCRSTCPWNLLKWHVRTNPCIEHHRTLAVWTQTTKDPGQYLRLLTKNLDLTTKTSKR